MGLVLGGQDSPPHAVTCRVLSVFLVQLRSTFPKAGESTCRPDSLVREPWLCCCFLESGVPWLSSSPRTPSQATSFVFLQGGLTSQQSVPFLSELGLCTWAVQWLCQPGPVLLGPSAHRPPRDSRGHCEFLLPEAKGLCLLPLLVCVLHVHRGVRMRVDESGRAVSAQTTGTRVLQGHWGR